MTPEERLAKLESELVNVRDDMHEVKADVKNILQQINRLDGGKRALWALLTAAGLLGGLIASLFKGWG